jgi:hypothetical protein
LRPNVLHDVINVAGEQRLNGDHIRPIGIFFA